MANQDVLAGFEELFASMSEESSEEDESIEEPETNEELDETNEDETNEESNEEEEEEEEESDEDSEEEDSEDKSKKASSKKYDKRSKQNYAFAQQRQTIKTQEKLIRNLGKAIGLNKDASLSEIADQVNKVLLAKQSKDTGVPQEILEELNALKSFKEENQILKRRTEVESTFASLIEEFKLDGDQVNEFTNYLIEEGKNPLEIDGIDIHYEYYKLHKDEIIQAKIDAAIEAEKERSEKVKQKSSSKVPGSSKTGSTAERKIETLAEADKFFNELDL